MDKTTTTKDQSENYECNITLVLNEIHRYSLSIKVFDGAAVAIGEVAYLKLLLLPDSLLVIFYHESNGVKSLNRQSLYFINSVIPPEYSLPVSVAIFEGFQWQTISETTFNEKMMDSFRLNVPKISPEKKRFGAVKDSQFIKKLRADTTPPPVPPELEDENPFQ